MVLKSDGLGDAHKLERRYCKTDLYYLGSKWLKMDFVEKVHRPVCEFFVHKNPDKPIEEQSPVKNRLLLDPRGHYKTTIDACDMVQWIIVFPDIRISMFSGSEDLVVQITDMVINQFRINEDFKELFFEHAMRIKDDYSRHMWDTPARNPESKLKLRGNTLFATTIGSVNTGSHCEVMKFDDCVTDINSTTPENRLKVVNRINALVPLVEPGCYTDFIGTRYAFDDKYGEFIEKLGDKPLKEIIPFGKILTAEDSKVFERQVATLPLTPQSTFLFPTKANGKVAFDWKEVQSRRRKLTEEQFGCQYLNDPKWGMESTFSEDMVRGSIIPYQSIPITRLNAMSGQKYIAVKAFQIWDLAFGEKKSADRTAGITGLFDQFGRLYFVDLQLGRFSADELVLRILESYRKWFWLLGAAGIEEAAGSKLIEPALNTVARSANIPLRIDWLKTSPKVTKRERILGLLPLWKAKRVFISADLPHLDQFIKEFTEFPKSRHDDIPDACSRLLEYQASVDITIPPTSQQKLSDPFAGLPIMPQEPLFSSPMGDFING